MKDLVIQIPGVVLIFILGIMIFTSIFVWSKGKDDFFFRTWEKIVISVICGVCFPIFWIIYGIYKYQNRK